MVGVAHTNFRRGEDCYSVVKTNGREEFLPSKFDEVLPEEHPAWKEFKETGLPCCARPVRAVVISPSVDDRDPLDPDSIGYEPCRKHYAVISCREYIDRLEKKLLKARYETAQAREDLTARLLEKHQEAYTARQELTDTIAEHAGQSAVKVAAIQNQVAAIQHQNEALQKSSKKLLGIYLAIGLAFGVAASFGAAAYQNYRASFQPLRENAPLEIKIEQP